MAVLPAAPFPQELLGENPRIIVEQLYQNSIAWAREQTGYSTTPFPAKSIKEVPGLLKRVIEDFEGRTDINDEDKLFFTVDEVDLTNHLEEITFSVARREPGGVGSGPPFAQGHKNLRPFLRDEGDDPDNPGYKKAVFGQWFDNVIRLTCWARRSWQAEERALWLEEVIEKYAWYLTMQGISRVFFWGRDADQMIENKNNKIYGKALNYYIRTERLSYVSTKKLEELVIKIGVQGG